MISFVKTSEKNTFRVLSYRRYPILEFPKP